MLTCVLCLCSGALCYPKVTGGKSQKAKLTCPQGFSMEKDASGKQMCVTLDCRHTFSQLCSLCCSIAAPAGWKPHPSSTDST